MLNRYLARMIAVIECYRGIIVDFYGDSILVFFNGMESDIALNAFGAVKSALEMQQELRRLCERKCRSRPACGHDGHRDYTRAKSSWATSALKPERNTE